MSDVPEMPADPTVLLAAAEALLPSAATARQRSTDAVRRWGSLPDVFDTPDTPSATTALAPVADAADDIDTTSRAVAGALRTLGEALAALRWTRARLVEDVTAHVADVLAYRATAESESEAAHGRLAGFGLEGWVRNEDLRDRCDHLRSRFAAALEECELDLRRIGAADPIPAGRTTAPWSPRGEDFAASVSLRILDRLTRTPPGEMERLLAAHPDWAALFRDNPPAPKTIVTWWQSLDATTATALVTGAPVLIGNLEGVAYSARDAANRNTLTREIARARTAVEMLDESHARRAGPSGGEGSRVATARRHLANLLNIEEALRAVPGAAGRRLITLTDDRPPLAAVAIGDPDTADNVTVVVPGMNTTTSDMTGWANGSQQIFDAQELASGRRSHAVIAWIGYVTPPIPVASGGFDVLGNDLAEAGGDRLALALSGLDATCMENEPAVRVVAHSYGTTTSAFALSRPDSVQVNTFVSVGSAGLPASIYSADHLHADEVYAAQAHNVLPFIEAGQGDQWAASGRLSTDHPIDPTRPDFHASSFGVDGDNGMHSVTDHSVLVSPGSGWGYFDRGTESLTNIALVTTGSETPPTPYLPKGLTPLQERLWEAMRLRGSRW